MRRSETDGVGRRPLGAKPPTHDAGQSLLLSSIKLPEELPLSLPSQLGGIVEEINFQSGDRVEKGQPLLRLRSDDDIAKLKALEAQVELARGRASRSARCSPCSSCRPSTSCSPRMIPRRA